jgi:hypothetical protein
VPSLARHVDLATVANETGKSKPDIQIDLSVHQSSDRVERSRAAPLND